MYRPVLAFVNQVDPWTLPVNPDPSQKAPELNNKGHVHDTDRKFRLNMELENRGYVHHTERKFRSNIEGLIPDGQSMQVCRLGSMMY